MQCFRCLQVITIKDQSLENEEGILIDTDYEAGHKIDCRYYKVNPDGGREWKDIVANAPMPVINTKWSREDEMRRRELIRQDWR